MVDGQIKSYMDITLLKSGYGSGLDKNSSIGLETITEVAVKT
jgi:hypothetical protein